MTLLFMNGCLIKCKSREQEGRMCHTIMLTLHSALHSALVISFYCFWPPLFLVRNQLLILLYMVNSSLLLLSKCSVSALTIMCLAMGLFVFILLGIYWGSWMCKLTFSSYLGSFWTLLLTMFSIPFSPLLLGLPLLFCWYVCWCSTGLWDSVHFSSFLLCSLVSRL